MMMAPEKYTRIVAALAGLAATIFSVSGTAQTTSTSTNTVRLAVRVFDHDGEPVGSLTANDFQVSVPGGGPMRVTLAAPPVHLVVLLSSGQGDLSAAGQAAVQQTLKPLWKAGWWISVRDAAGRQTPYLADGAGLHAIAGLHAPVAAAVGTLAEFTGRRVVFVVTGRGFDVDDETMRLARQYHAMLYQVGVARSNRFQPGSSGGNVSFQEFSGSGDVIAQATFPGFDFPPTPATPYLHQETSLPAAVRHALEDGNGFYDMRTQVPADAHTLTLALHLKHPTDDHYQVQAQPYAEGTGPLPTVRIESEGR